MFGITILLLSNDVFLLAEDDEPGGDDDDVPEPWFPKGRMWGLTSGGSADVACNWSGVIR